MFKLAGKTHYSNVSFRVDSIISTGLSALVFTSSPVLAFTDKLPYSGSYLKTRVSQGSNDRFTVGEFFQYRFLQMLFKTRCARKKNTQTKVANTKCRLFAIVLMHPAGLSWFKIMRPL